MIQWVQGDILAAQAEALVNTVNCVGVMGRGIALQFRKAFPENFDAYRKACARGELRPGALFVFEANRLHGPRFIINFPTKRHWRGKSRIEDIRLGLESLVEEVRRRGISSIAVPPLGCGLGGLDWQRVRPLIEDSFASLPAVQVLVYEPLGSTEAAQRRIAELATEKAPKMTTGRAALLVLMRRYLAAVMDPFLSLLEVHKLMYLMQEAGEPLRLRFAKGLYGPYAENLRHVLTEIEGHFISGYNDAEDAPDKQIELNASAGKLAEEHLHGQPETQARLNRVASLIDGFETPFGMELLATVHWVARHESAGNADEALTKVYSWNPRKRMFREADIRLAWASLESGGWLAES